jgi:preprotein translocase subunit SecE
MVGLRRYVHIAFAVAGILLGFVLINLFVLIGGAVGWSTSVLGFDVWSTAAVVVTAVVTITMWRREKVFGFVFEVAEELKKVTWPTYEETRTATWVVIAMVAIFSVGLGIYDFLVVNLTYGLMWLTNQLLG